MAKQKFKIASFKFADRVAVIESILDAKKYFFKNNWLTKNNRYSINTTERLKLDLKVDIPKGYNKNLFRSSKKQHHLKSYVGVSSIIHCYDGWKYLSKAVSSAMQFDFTISRHLAYYAELRAALSILCSFGISIFDRQHIILGKRQIYDQSGMSTHQIVWPALKYLINKRDTSYSLLEIIRPDQHSLIDWLGALGITVYREQIGKDWLKTWGLDIRKFSVDRSSRNFLSYRPTQLNKNLFIDLKKLLDLINNIWESSEFPTFKNIDIQLLKRSLLKGFELKTSNSAFDYNNYYNDDYKKEMEMLIRNLSPTGYSSEYWFNYLTNPSHDSFLIQEASETSNLYDSNHYVQMISRAFLLLRISSGFVKQNLEDAGVAGEELKFWWQPLIQYLGYSNIEIELNDLNDVLFTDIQSSINQLNIYSQKPGFFSDTYSWCDNYYEEKEKLSQLERIGIMAIAS